MTCEVTVVLPMYHNEKTIGKLLEGLRDHLFPRRIQVIGVDDASTDRVGEVFATTAKSLGLDHLLVRHEENKGKHKALITGMSLATGRLVVLMDADLQDPPSLIPKLLKEQAASGSSIVFAQRDGKTATHFNRLASWTVKTLFLRLAGLRYPADVGSFSVMKLEVCREIASHAGPDPWVTGALLGSRLPISFVRYYREANPHGVTGFSLRKRAVLGSNVLKLGIRMFISQTRFARRPGGRF